MVQQKQELWQLATSGMVVSIGVAVAIAVSNSQVSISIAGIAVIVT